MKNENVYYFVSNGSVYSAWSKNGALKTNMPSGKVCFIEHERISCLRNIRFSDGNVYALFDNLVQPMALVSSPDRTHFIDNNKVINYFDHKTKKIGVSIAGNIDEISIRKNKDGTQSILFLDFKGSPMITESYILMSAADLTINLSENKNNALIAA